MTTAAAMTKIVKGHLRSPGPLDTCVSNGLHRWAVEAGLKYPSWVPGYLNPASSVSGLRAAVLSQSHANGWTYHPGTDGLRVGDFVDWKNWAHVSYVTAINASGVQSIGSGNMTSNPPIVDYQPKGGGFNARSNFRGYFRPPYSSAPAPAPAVPKKYKMTLARRKLIASHMNARFKKKLHTSAASTGRVGPVYWRMIQRAGRADGLYGKGYVINGIPGPRTLLLEQHYYRLWN